MNVIRIYTIRYGRLRIKIEFQNTVYGHSTIGSPYRYKQIYPRPSCNFCDAISIIPAGHFRQNFKMSLL